MKSKILLLITIFVSSCFSIFSGPYDLDVERTAYMRNNIVLSFWDAKLIGDELEGYIVGYGMNNSFGDDRIFAGISFVYFQFLEEFDHIEPVGIDVGLDIGMQIPLTKNENLLLAAGYSYFKLKDFGDAGFSPSARIGINSSIFTFSLGYNFRYGVFSTIGVQQAL